MGGTPQPTQLIAWAPFSRPQAQLLSCPASEILFGGARGGGKTDAMIGKFAMKQAKYGKNAVGVFFRATRVDLKEAIERSREIYGPMGAKLVDKQWTFPSGARLKFEYLERTNDAANYQGHSYSDLFFEELTNWASPDPINMLRATLRSGAGIPCQFHATANPGAPGHQWVKARYIDPCPEGGKMLYEDYKNPFTKETVRMSRVFIPSKLSDNPTLMADPSYVARLYQSGSAESGLGCTAIGILWMARSSIAGVLRATSCGRFTYRPTGCAFDRATGVAPNRSPLVGGLSVPTRSQRLTAMSYRAALWFGTESGMALPKTPTAR